MPWSSGFFFELTARLTENFPNIFSEGAEEGTDYTATGNFGKKWSGYQTIATLAGGDLTKFDQVTTLPVMQCLTFLSYKVDEAQMLQQQMKQK